MTYTELIATRTELKNTARALYSPEDFPGSTRYMACLKAERALKAFDAEHPEILAEIKAVSAAKAPAPESAAVARALRGED